MALTSAPRPFGWLAILRLGLVQSALGAIVVLTTSTMNRVMVVELALPAMVPGVLVALHYFVQLLRPRLGWGSDVGGRRTPWILGGMAVLGLGGVGVACAIALIPGLPLAGFALAVLSFVLVGVGVGSCGTAMLVMLSKRVEPRLRPAAATVTWLMMIVGFIVTSAVAGHFLDPFSPSRLVSVTLAAAAIAFALTTLAVVGLEGAGDGLVSEAASDEIIAAQLRTARHSFARALADVWGERESRRLAMFIFISMLAYSAQELILEPFAGAVFGLTPGESTRLAGVQNAGVLTGMIAIAVVGSAVGRGRFGSMRSWTVIGCIGSALALAGLSASALVGSAWPLRATVFVLGLANGTFAVSAIGSMMEFVGAGKQAREGVRMGVWGAAQAVAFAIGGLFGTISVDLTRYAFGTPIVAYATVFAAEAALFLVASAIASRLGQGAAAVAPARARGEGGRGHEFGEPARLVATVAGRR